MIVYKCPVCRRDFEDYCGENAADNVNGEMIDYDRYYRCPHCGSYFDTHTQRIVNYDDIKNLAPEDYGEDRLQS